MRGIVVGVLLLVARPASAAPLRSAPTTPTPVAGIAINLDASASAAERQASFETIRRTGASFFVLELSWSRAEPHPREYRLEEITRAARLLRQFGATLHLDLPLVTESARDVPADLESVAFDDSKLSLRLGRLLDALMPALLDFQTLSLGNAADIYFSDRPAELHAYRRLFDGAVGFLQKKVPHLLVGVTTTAPTESHAPEVAAALHQRSPLLLYIYSPFARGALFTQRDPASLERDWLALVKSAAGRPIAFPVVSYSSSAENGSSVQKQADFIRRFRHFLARADGRTIRFARYVALRDPASDALPPVEPGGNIVERRRRAFLANRGLQNAAGEPKTAWREWVKAGR